MPTKKKPAEKKKEELIEYDPEKAADFIKTRCPGLSRKLIAEVIEADYYYLMSLGLVPKDEA